MTSKLIFATRPSALARWQTEYVIERLRDHWKDLICETQVITTKGDRILDKALPEIGGKGLFTYELEQALRAGFVDAAVHSLKDLPTNDPLGLAIGGIPWRADYRDVLVCPAGFLLEDMPANALVGTSSVRRRAQLLAYRPDLRVEPIRGNVDTRIRKAIEGRYDAILLAAAGLTRLDFQEHITQYLPLDIMLPAPGQGALAVQCRSDDRKTLHLLSAIEHPNTRATVTAERAFLSALGGGCSLPVGALAQCHNQEIELRGVVVDPDGSRTLRLTASGKDPLDLGERLAREAFESGAGDYLTSTRVQNE